MIRIGVDFGGTCGSTCFSDELVHSTATSGLVALIANGYRALAYIFLGVYVLPLLTVGVLRLWRGRQTLSEVS